MNEQTPGEVATNDRLGRTAGAGSSERPDAGPAAAVPPQAGVTEHDADLDLLLTALANARREPPNGPDPFGEGPWSDHHTWLRAVRTARRHADVSAIRHEAQVDRLSAELLGTTAREVLGLPQADLTMEHRTLRVPEVAQISDLVPSLAGHAPLGPSSAVDDDKEAGSDGARVDLRLVRPPEARRTVVRVHGGGFWMGGGEVLEHVDTLLLEALALTLNAVVIDVDHRLAPEHPYPAAVVDVLTVLDAVSAARGREQAAARDAGLGLLDAPLALPGGGIALVGTSSGANAVVLAAVADAERSRAHGIGRRVDALALIEPSVDLSSAPDALRQNEDAWAHRVRQLRAHVGDELSLADPWVSPARASRLPGLPPTLVIEAARDEVARGGPGLVRAVRAGGGEAMEQVFDMTHTVATPGTRAAMITAVTDFLDTRLP